MGIDKNLVQGSMALLLLRLLETKDMYGYEMIEALRSKSNNVFELKAGTLYPLLHSLESKGYVRSYEDASSGKKRRYYQLTEAGRHHSSEKKQEWMAYQAAVSNVLSFESFSQVSAILADFLLSILNLGCPLWVSIKIIFLGLRQPFQHRHQYIARLELN